MCGIIGYIGHQQATPLLMEALSRLEYRGYDSSGIVVRNDGLAVHKCVGKVANLGAVIPEDLAGTTGIARTAPRMAESRWFTMASSRM